MVLQYNELDLNDRDCNHFFWSFIYRFLVEMIIFLMFAVSISSSLQSSLIPGFSQHFTVLSKCLENKLNTYSAAFISALESPMQIKFKVTRLLLIGSRISMNVFLFHCYDSHGKISSYRLRAEITLIPNLLMTFLVLGIKFLRQCSIHPSTALVMI